MHFKNKGLLSKEYEILVRQEEYVKNLLHMTVVDNAL
jgi:hypothetical protein